MQYGFDFFVRGRIYPRNCITFACDMDMEQLKISKVQIAAFLIIGAGLYFLTSSFFIALGVMVALIVVVNTAALYIIRRRKKKEDEHD